MHTNFAIDIQVDKSSSKIMNIAIFVLWQNNELH